MARAPARTSRPPDGDETDLLDMGELGDQMDPGNEEPGGDEQGQPPQQQQQAPDWQAAFNGLQQQVQSLARENELLRRAIPPAGAPREQQGQPEPIDWDQEFYQSPGQAINRAMSMAKEETKRELTQQYQRDQSTRGFWDGFYQANPKLRDVRDVVEKVLERNLGTLSPMPVSDAMTKLAELTNERLDQIASIKQSRRKVAVEGASGGQPALITPRAPANENVTTLSDLIRARKNRINKRPS